MLVGERLQIGVAGPGHDYGQQMGGQVAVVEAGPGVTHQRHVDEVGRAEAAVQQLEQLW